ncbi:phosphodiester glycosidase family protein [Kitasatospora sp. NPDC093558]|uniref:phosphodiester glycosidase family protein n=1 Tax=Kitasatospora sp. NPDC093558 TaxID=3155201 RepID=UPI003422EC8E
MRKTRSLLPALLVLGLVPIAVPSSSFAADAPSASLPLSQMPIGQYDPADPKTWTVAWPKDGPQKIDGDALTYRAYSQGFPSSTPHGEAAGDHWTLSVFYDPAGKAADVLRMSKSDAENLLANLVHDVPGLAGQARTEPIYAPTSGWNADVPAASDAVGWAVRVGRFDTKADAAAFLNDGKLGYVLDKDGKPVMKDGKPVRYTARVLYDALDGRPTTGPWTVRVVTIDPAKYNVQTTFGGTIANPDTVRELVKASGAVVGVNASEGVPGKYEPGVPAPDVYTGDVQGVQVRNDGIYSEATDGRSALVLNGRDPADPNGAIVPARIGQVSTTIKVTATDPVTHQPDQRTIFGVNRPAGYVVGCGSAATEVTTALRYYPCKNLNDLTVIRSEWGTNTPVVAPEIKAQLKDEPFELLLDANWVVKDVHKPGDKIEPGQIVLQGIGTSADWLKKYQQAGTALKPAGDILDTPTGKSITSADLGVVAGGCGPSLLRDGEVYLTMKADGIFNKGGVLNNWAAERYARTMVGITDKGKIQMVTVDGRDASTSIGMSILETARLMKWLGAKQALSMGCGGDTGLIMNGVLYNNPMDDWGTPDQKNPYERRLPNALVAVKK